jgi:folate-dependent phosphoribosylglycinamide formyltransferase PurN
MDKPTTLVAVADESQLGRAVLRYSFSRFDVQAVLLPTREMIERFNAAPSYAASPRRPLRSRLGDALRPRRGPRSIPPQESFDDRGLGERLSWPEVRERWAPGTFDLMLSAGFPAVFPDRVLEVAGRRVNIHTSLLPQLKGRHPHYWAVAWRLPRSGLTAHEMTQEVDGGRIVGQVVVEIGRKTDYYQHYADLCAAVPGVLDQVLAWVATGEHVLGVDVEESWSPGEPDPALPRP